jgi:hypothetical protein
VLQRFGGDFGGFDFEGGDRGLEFALVVLVVDAGFEVPVAVGALRELAQLVRARAYHRSEAVVQAFGWELDLDLNLCGIGKGGGIGHGRLRTGLGFDERAKQENAGKNRTEFHGRLRPLLKGELSER